VATGDEELHAIKDRAAARFGALPGVTGVGLGGRVRGGELVEELVLKVYVDRKRAPGEVPGDQLIPAEFEGLPTDVVEMPGTGQLIQAAPPPPTGKSAVPIALADGDRYRPLRGGTQMMPDITGAGRGTLGCFMVTPGDPSKVYALTNWHVVEGSRGTPPATTVIQPTVGATKAGQPDAEDSVTKCCSSIAGKVAGGARTTNRDAALVLLDPGAEWFADIHEIGAVAGSRPPFTPAEVAAHPQVRKRGMRSGLTGGTVDSVGGSFTVSGNTFNNVIVVRPNPDPANPATATNPVFFADHGDSGSALVDADNRVVGLVFSIPNPSGPPNPGYHGLINGWALPIADVIAQFAAVEHLTVAVATAAAPQAKNTVPGAAMVAVAPELAPVLAGTPDAAPEAPPDPAREPLAAARRRPRVALPALGAPPPSAAALATLQQRLDRSARGRALITLWLGHQAELLDLVNHNRRVATTWHRSGASAVFSVLVRMLSQPDLTLPETLDGRPLDTALDRVCATLDRFASEPLRRAIASAREGLPDLGGLTFDGICDALETAR